MKPSQSITLKSCVAVLGLSIITLISCSANSEARGNEASTILQHATITNSTNIAALPSAIPTVSKKKIKIALLLDTSSSMDGLIDQAKSQLWKLIRW